jgi:predicted enzyme related to lactoylglutathione lyase
MTNSAGNFVWYELMTTDTKAAENFYRDAVGWQARDAGMQGMSYTIFSAGDAMIGGLMELPKSAREAGGKPAWIGYVAVADVDASASQVSRLGGRVHRQPDDIPGVGRFAIVADPQGATFALFSGTGEGHRPAREAPGNIGWHELVAADWQKAFDFYSGLFGWTKAESIEMGPMGTYQLFAAGGETIGGMMTRTDTDPFWFYYLNVDAIDAAQDRVKKGGGKIINGPMEVPGGSWIVHCLDPQGVVFALVAPRR